MCSGEVQLLCTSVPWRLVAPAFKPLFHLEGLRCTWPGSTCCRHAPSSRLWLYAAKGLLQGSSQSVVREHFLTRGFARGSSRLVERLLLLLQWQAAPLHWMIWTHPELAATSTGRACRHRSPLVAAGWVRRGAQHPQQQVALGCRLIRLGACSCPSAEVWCAALCG